MARGSSAATTSNRLTEHSSRWAPANLGNEIVPRTDNSLVVMANDGSIVRALPAPMPKATCSPVKWWAPDLILTHCDGENDAGEQLWEVPLNGGKPTALTAVNTHDNAPGFQGNYGNWNAFGSPMARSFSPRERAAPRSCPG